MHQSDRHDFAAAMTRLFAVYGEELTEAMLEAWWGVLGGHELREVRWAMNAHVTDPDKGRFRPTPADIIRHATQTLPAHRAQQRNQRIREARERMAPLEDELYHLRSKLEHGLIPDEDRQPVLARINGLTMQLGAMTREAGINDRPRITHERAPARTIGAVVNELGYDDADPENDA